MALKDIQLTLMTFPQRWDGKLHVNVLLLPVGDPTAPLGSGPKFAGTSVPLVVSVIAGLDALPTIASVPAWTHTLLAKAPVLAPALFDSLRNQFASKGISVTSGPYKTTLSKPPRIRKSLPPSYTEAFAYDGPRSRDASPGDEYCCALREQALPLNGPQPKPDNAIAWGQIISFAMRQPVLARHLGLIHRFILDVPHGLLDNGGFVQVTLDPASNPWGAAWPASVESVRSYAARLPELAATTAARPLFAATLFPVVATIGDLADAQQEAEQYDDGFAQIVHSNQPSTIDAATLQSDQIAPGTEAGIQVGWDDEQVTIWLNNQVGLLHARATGGASPNGEAALGVQGYRVDVRRQGSGNDWHSLAAIKGTLTLTTAAGGNPPISLDGHELWVAPAPLRPARNDNGANDQPAWLPMYFAQWAGASLVLPDPVVTLLAYAVANANTGGTPTLPPPTLPNPYPDLTAVPLLRYGQSYEFRVRLVDLTGGGPLRGEPAIHPGPAPTSLASFRRFVPPKSLEVLASPANPGYPEKPPAPRAIETLTVRRPRIGYPEAVFAGVDPATFEAGNLGALIQDAWESGRAISVPDPDVDSFEVRVEARIPAHDTGKSGSLPGELDDNFRVIYSVKIPFPAQADDDSSVTLTFDYADGYDDIAKIPHPAAGTTSLTIPTARDIRIRLFPQCAARDNYYGGDAPLVGLSSDYIVRKESSVEDAIFPNNPATQLQAFYFQPGANVPQLLAQSLGLNQNGLVFSGATGFRTVFGASGGLRHQISPDAGSISISNQTELLGHWIVVLALDLERDWTWDGFREPALQFARNDAVIGTITYPRVVAASASGNPGQTPDRRRARILFFDAIDPSPALGKFPAEIHRRYSVTANFDSAASQRFEWAIRLPITTPPAQTPRIVSTGIAESPFHRSRNYAETSLRDRYLWIEFDQPPADPDDAFFARSLAYGPDPLLAADVMLAFVAQSLPETVEPPLPIDPEAVRRIFSGQSEDFAGLDAMTQLIPALPAGIGHSGCFFLLPLPQGISSEDLDLFGFWTYEFRVGHASRWSTAQGRYGRPLRVAGIQHPAPHLICSIDRSHKRIEVDAPYATTLYNGKRVYDIIDGDPQTRIWFMLYAQVMQADGASFRNVLLGRKLGHRLPNPKSAPNPNHSVNREPRSATSFAEKFVADRLALIGLPATSSLSVLAVEVLPGPLTFRRDYWQPGETISGGSRARSTATAANSDAEEDPLGAGLGVRRVLRTSPLTAVPAVC